MKRIFLLYILFAYISLRGIEIVYPESLANEFNNIGKFGLLFVSEELYYGYMYQSVINKIFTNADAKLGEIRYNQAKFG